MTTQTINTLWKSSCTGFKPVQDYNIFLYSLQNQSSLVEFPVIEIKEKSATSKSTNIDAKTTPINLPEYKCNHEALVDYPIFDAITNKFWQYTLLTDKTDINLNIDTTITQLGSDQIQDTTAYYSTILNTKSKYYTLEQLYLDINKAQAPAQAPAQADGTVNERIYLYHDVMFNTLFTIKATYKYKIDILLQTQPESQITNVRLKQIKPIYDNNNVVEVCFNKSVHRFTPKLEPDGSIFIAQFTHKNRTLSASGLSFTFNKVLQKLIQ